MLTRALFWPDGQVTGASVVQPADVPFVGISRVPASASTPGSMLRWLLRRVLLRRSLSRRLIPTILRRLPGLVQWLFPWLFSRLFWRLFLAMFLRPFAQPCLRSNFSSRVAVKAHRPPLSSPESFAAVDADPVQAFPVRMFPVGFMRAGSNSAGFPCPGRTDRRRPSSWAGVLMTTASPPAAVIGSDLPVASLKPVPQFSR